ncbi:hypothetical protein JHK87_003860 [Glycine soja]|nr:hypothetical protein JHK87_003860 [Glycine soja]
MAAKSPHDSSFSFSRRYFHWKKKALDESDNEEEILNFSSSSSYFPEEVNDNQDDHNHNHNHHLTLQMPSQYNAKKKTHFSKKSKFKSVLTIFTITRVPRLRLNNISNSFNLDMRVMGTLFGHRRDHVYFAFQEDPKLGPTFLVKLATRTSTLVREMASGLVRIALECEKKKNATAKVRLLEEPLWRTYCNGRKCGYANRRECGPHEWKILKAVEPISMGAGVLPVVCGNEAAGSEEEASGEVMYMRAKYERVVGSRDSEAFYMMNPDASGGPELSIYLIRV